MKKITLLLLVFSTLIVYFGCGDQQQITGPDQQSVNSGKAEIDGVPMADVFTVTLYETVKLYYHPFHNYYAGLYEREIGIITLTLRDGIEYSVNNIQIPSDGTIGVGGIMYCYWHDNSPDCNYFYRINYTAAFSQNSSTVTYYLKDGSGNTKGSKFENIPANGGSGFYRWQYITDLPAPGSNTMLQKFAAKWTVNY